MVPMRRKHRMMGEDSSYDLLRRAQWVTLAMVNARPESPLGVGSPYAIPISVVEYEGSFFFHCGLQGHKIDNLKEDNRVCISCVGNAEVDEEHFSFRYQSAVFFATVEQVLDHKYKEQVLFALSKRYAPSVDSREEIAKVGAKTGIWKLHIVGSSGKQRKFE